jgi:hypothetical protein
MVLKSNQGDFKKTINPTEYDDKYLRYKPAKDVLRRQKLINRSHETLNELCCSFVTSLLMMGLQLLHISKLGWLIGLTSRDMWANSSHFLYIMLGSIYSRHTLPSFQHILWPSSDTCWATFDLSNRPCLRMCLCSLMNTSRSVSIADITSSVFTGNALCAVNLSLV